MTFIDTNVLLDVVTDDAEWFEWSAKAIQNQANQGPLYTNAIVYAELSARYSSVEAVDEFVAQAGAQILEIPRAAAFLAAKAFIRYRAVRGRKTGVLADFFIGAHAATLDIPLLTRDVGRYRTYFPNLHLIAPHLN